MPLPSIRIEGGLLGPDMIDQLLTGDLPGQRPADFGLPAKRNLTDEIAATFADARAMWGVFQRRLARVPSDDLATSVTRDAWAIPFLGLLGYEPRFNQKAYEVDGMSFAVSHRASEADDSPPVHIVGWRQELGRVPVSGRPRLAPHSLLQEFLNRTENVWGVVTNGQTLRLLRDCTFVRRQAYVEFDLPAILDEQRFQDFAALYRLLHRTRLPQGIADVEECLLETYHTQSVEQGGRVREHLREGVERCLELLANGFLRPPANSELRHRISPACTGNDKIAVEDFYRQLLILVYRFLFLLVSEDRGLLSDNTLYRDHYGIARLRRLLGERATFTEHDDLWQSLRVLWMVLVKDDLQPALNNQPLASVLGLQVLNGDLFAALDIDRYSITNLDLLSSIWHLAWYQEKTTAPPRRVNYAALDVEELGSVYESLLEFHPAIDADGRGRPVFSFITGSERKTTGSYYTPPELVGELVKSALEPVLAERLAPCRTQEDKRQAILSIRVCDPACGSGHFLLAAARRLGKELARVVTGDDEPAPERMREAIREVISHCIYGVDRNPLAVDLCRVALWLESHTAEKPLTFLDHRIRCGDSLVGVFDLSVLVQGIPDEAFKPLEGDDKAAARELLRRNRDERSGGRDLFSGEADTSVEAIEQQSRALDAIADDSPEAIRRKKRLFEESHAAPAWRRNRQGCDLWTAAFFQPLRADTPAVTSAALAEHLAGHSIDPRVVGLAESLAIRQRFFHWPLEFPEVFADGGFDCLLSNPPWERVKLQEQEFFAVRDARIATAANKAARAKLIRDLPDENPSLHAEFIQALRGASGAGSFMRHSGRFPLAGRGDINTYAVFAELGSLATAPSGRAGMVLPKGIATDDTTKFFFGDLVSAGRLISLVGFENEDFIFPAVDHRVTFCTLTIGGVGHPETRSRIAFYIRKFSQLNEEQRFFSLDKDEFWLLNPNTGNCPIFRAQADAELTKAIYRRVPVLWQEAQADRLESNPWRLSFKTLFHMSNDSHHFRTAGELAADGYRLEGNVFVSPYDRYLPLYEAKMLHQFDHRFSTYEGATERQLNVGILPQPTAEQKRTPAFVVQPRYWVREEIVESTIPKYPDPLAMALQLEHRPSIQRVLLWWAAGYHLLVGQADEATTLLQTANRFDLERSVDRTFPVEGNEARARLLAADFALDAEQAAAIARDINQPEELARQLVERFSPKWFMGWREIARSTDARTMIATATPHAAFGNKFPLAFSPFCLAARLALLANLNSFAMDYCARQKLGGTSFSYFVIRQLPLLSPQTYEKHAAWATSSTLKDWLAPRLLELLYTAHDTRPIAMDHGYNGPPFVWDEERRFELRAELDAAMFHLYLPATADGDWQPAEQEAPQQLAALRQHFPRPRDAVAYILEQFPIVRDKDEKTHGSYRTKDRVLAIYDQMLAAQSSGHPYLTTLDPPPGERAS